MEYVFFHIVNHHLNATIEPQKESTQIELLVSIYIYDGNNVGIILMSISWE